VPTTPAGGSEGGKDKVGIPRDHHPADKDHWGRLSVCDGTAQRQTDGRFRLTERYNSK
jgi:hypothetical protein